MAHLCDSCDRFFNSPERVLSDRADLIEDGIPILQWDRHTGFVRAEVLKDEYLDFRVLAKSARAECTLCKILIEGLLKRIAHGERDEHYELRRRLEHFKYSKM
jgi:hypothetical protein